MTSNTISHFKCMKCGEINTVSDLTQIKDKEKVWSLRCNEIAIRKFNQLSGKYGLKAADTLSYLLALEDIKETNMSEGNRFGTPGTSK